MSFLGSRAGIGSKARIKREVKDFSTKDGLWYFDPNQIGSNRGNDDDDNDNNTCDNDDA